MKSFLFSSGTPKTWFGNCRVLLEDPFLFAHFSKWDHEPVNNIKYGWWFRNPAFTSYSVEVGSLSHYLAQQQTVTAFQPSGWWFIMGWSVATRHPWCGRWRLSLLRWTPLLMKVFLYENRLAWSSQDRWRFVFSWFGWNFWSRPITDMAFWGLPQKTQ